MFTLTSALMMMTAAAPASAWRCPFLVAWLLGRGETVRTSPPVSDLGLVNFVATIIDRQEAWGGADRTVDVDHPAADSTDQMMMVVTDPILEASR
jgi:hypothetical protein